MHEFSLCQGLLAALQKLPSQKKGRSLRRIEVTVGPLAGVEKELLEHAFPLVVKNTAFSNVKLDVKHRDIIVRCLDCGQENTAKINDLRCATCSSEWTQVLQGNECALTHLYYGETEHV